MNKMKLWFSAEEIPNNHHFMMGFPTRGFVTLYPKYGAGNFIREYATEFREGMSWMLFPVDDFTRSAQYIADKMITKPEWAMRLAQKTLNVAEQFVARGEDIRQAPLPALSDRALVRLVERCFPLHEFFHGIAPSIGWIVDCYEEYFSGAVRARISELLKMRRNRHDVGFVFSLLSTPLASTNAEQEERSFLTIAASLRKKKSLVRRFQQEDITVLRRFLSSKEPTVWKAIEQHWWQYTWLEFMYTGPERTLDDFLALWQSFVRAGDDPRPRLQEIAHRLPRLQREQKALLQSLQPDAHLKKIIDLTQLIAWSKPTRKDALFHGHYCYALAFRELAKRMGLTMQQFWQFVPWEIHDAVLNSRFDVHELNARRTASVAYVTHRSYRILTGNAYTRWITEHPRKKVLPIDTSTLVGSCACPGKVRGRVCVVNLPEEMKKMRTGNIMVSHSTNPNLLSAMKMASAIVTDAGGLTSHAAIVSRELRIPCVVGTKFATQVFKDDDRVEVDAIKGIVKKL